MFCFLGCFTFQRLLRLQRSTAVQVRSTVRLMPQNQPSGRGLLPSPAARSQDQHHAAMLADVSRHILGRTEGRGLGFGQLVRSHTRKCLKCQSSSDGHSDHSALCAGGRCGLLGPLQSPDWAKVCLVSTIFFLPVSIEPGVEKCLGLSVGDRVLCLRRLTANFLQVCLLFRFLSVPHEPAPTGGILKTELSAWQGRSAGPGSSGLDQSVLPRVEGL